MELTDGGNTIPFIARYRKEATEELDESVIPPHRIVAMNRGEKEEFLAVKIEAPLETLHRIIELRYVKTGPCASLVQKAALEAYKRLIEPSIEREVRAELSDGAEQQAPLNHRAKRVRFMGKNKIQCR